MSEKQFNCVLGKDYHIINNNVDNMTYFLQDGNDVVLVINLMNRLVEENEQLKQSNDRFADTVAKQVSLLIELRKENEQLRNELDKYKIVILQFVGLLVENGIIDSSVKEEVDELLEELSGDGV